MPVQTREELHQILTLWIEKHAPKDLELEGPKGEENGRKVVQRTREYFGFVSIHNLNESVKALADELHFKPKKSQQQLDVEAAQQQLRNQQVREGENRYNHAKAQEKKQPNAEQQIKDGAKTLLGDEAAQIHAKQEVENICTSYECYAGPNRRDGVRTDKGRRELSAIRISNGRSGVDWVATLQAVRKRYNELP